jgi:hypothetical protein
MNLAAWILVLLLNGNLATATFSTVDACIGAAMQLAEREPGLRAWCASVQSGEVRWPSAANRAGVRR